MTLHKILEARTKKQDRNKVTEEFLPTFTQFACACPPTCWFQFKHVVIVCGCVYIYFSLCFYCMVELCPNKEAIPVLVKLANVCLSQTRNYDEIYF